MPKLIMNIEVHNEPSFTVRQMRRKLAQILSKMKGDQIVSFSFNATLGDYQPNATENNR